MKRSNLNKETNLLNKITKVSLVIYFVIIACEMASCISISAFLKQWPIMWGFLLCLGPSLIFALISTFLPFERIVQKGSSKGLIALYVILYVIKYCLVFFIPIIGIKNPSNFNKWSMLATTLIAPLTIIISKIIIACLLNKKSSTEKENEEKPKNTIKF